MNSKINKIGSPVYNIGEIVCYGQGPFCSAVTNRRWNPKRYLGNDGTGGWEYLVENGRRNFWYNERVIHSSYEN